MSNRPVAAIRGRPDKGEPLQHRGCRVPSSALLAPSNGLRLGDRGDEVGTPVLAGFQPFHALALAVMLLTVVTRVA